MSLFTEICPQAPRSGSKAKKVIYMEKAIKVPPTIRQLNESDGDCILISLDLTEIAGDLQYATGLDASHLTFEDMSSNTSVRIPLYAGLIQDHPQAMLMHAASYKHTHLLSVKASGSSLQFSWSSLFDTVKDFAVSAAPVVLDLLNKKSLLTGPANGWSELQGSIVGNIMASVYSSINKLLNIRGNSDNCIQLA